MSLFGDLPGVQPCVVPTSTPALQKALAFMSGLAKRYCDGEIEDAPALKKERNRLLEEMGLARSKTNTQNKTAAKSVSPPRPMLESSELAAGAAESTETTTAPEIPTKTPREFCEVEYVAFTTIAYGPPESIEEEVLDIAFMTQDLTFNGAGRRWLET